MVTIATKRSRELDFLRDDCDLTNADLRFLNIFTKNIPLLCHHVLNIDILSFQHMIQEILLFKFFPMLVCSRGFSKTFNLGLNAIIRAIIMPRSKIIMVSNSFRQCVVGDTVVLTKNGEKQIKDIEIGDELLGVNKYNKVIDKWENCACPTKKITTLEGYTIEGDIKHRILCKNNNKYEWKTLDSLRVNDSVEILKALITNPLYTNGMISDKIISISDGFNITYDISLEKAHDYCSNRFISHNSKRIFEEAEMIYNKAPLVQQCHSSINKSTDLWEMRIGSSSIVAIPLGPQGEKVRGLRGTCIMLDEAQNMPWDIFNIVIRGFAIVSHSPVEQVRELERKKRMAEMGLIAEDEFLKQKSNQIILSGTACFQFQDFYKIYLQYKNIIEDKIYGKIPIGDIEEYVNHNDYAILQISYQDLPEGFLDKKQLANSRLSMPEALFKMEYEAQFITDTEGFFKRSLLESATPTGRDGFGTQFKGNKDSFYVMGVDAARGAGANFAIVVLELCGEISKIKYCWTTHSMDFPSSTKKVREVLRNFNVVRADFDKLGGGQTVIDLLSEDSLIPPGEEPIVEIDSEKQGIKIIEAIQFNPSWLSDANYGLRSDFEHKRILFPAMPGEEEVDGSDPYYYDKVDEVFAEIQEMKNEVCKIVATTTKTGNIHWDLPEGSPKKSRKDRYSALLLAAYAARQVRNKTIKTTELAEGGWPEMLV
jgi:intein/homing endonuclease